MKLEQIFEKCLKLSSSKREDYVTVPGVDNHENFKRSAEIASWFRHDRDKAYAVLIGTKLARLGSLLSKESKPNNESIEDTFVDLINYCALWGERVLPPTVEELNEILKSEITPYENHPFQGGSGPNISFCIICLQHKSRHSV